jgi:glutamate synthase (ferredoxin)
MSSRPLEPPLYDASFEHDACGVGFVADARGLAPGRVLPLALAGLGALGHRGAFGADGASSDGAGLALPMEPSVLRSIAPGLRGPLGLVVLFLPRGRQRKRAEGIARSALSDAGCDLLRWRPVPMEASALGPAAAASRPFVVHAFVRAGPGRRLPLETRLVVARRTIEAEARAAGIDDLSIPSASSRLVVYKGLVAGGRLADLYPDLAAPLSVSHVVFHQRYATNTAPEWRLAQPFRRLAHNGEIDTVRGNREQVRGRAADLVRTPAGRALGSGPLLAPDGSDSLSLDEMVEALERTGWDPFAALLALVPEAPALRREAHPLAAAHARRVSGFLAPWDGPGAFVMSDGRRVGALLDRNGLRPLAYAVSADGLVVAASEAGAVPLPARETVRRGRLGPGELLLVDPRRGLILEDAEAKTEILRHTWLPDAPLPTFADRPAAASPRGPTPASIRALAGLDAERHRLHVKTMVLEGHEPLWSMGDDTPTAALGRVDRPVTDHLRQAFAQVTNPPIDPERERAVMDLTVTLGRRPALLGGLPGVHPETLRVARPYVADLEGLLVASRSRAVRLDATWDAAVGPEGLAAAVERLGVEAVQAARGGAAVVVVSDASLSLGHPLVPAVLAAGAVHAALTAAGLRGRCDVVADAADTLDVHAAAMVLAAGATVVHPWLALELAGELAGGRGAEDLGAVEARERLLDALAAGLRKTLGRMGIATAASYVGANLIESVELAPEVLAACLPAAAAWPGRVGFEAIAARLLRRAQAAGALADDHPAHRLPDPGLARFRADGEHHGYAPTVVGAVQALADEVEDELERPSGRGPAGSGAAGPGAAIAAETGPPPSGDEDRAVDAIQRYRDTLEREPATLREQLTIIRRHPVPLDEVEPASAIVRRFVAAAMSVGALSPEAHQAVTIGMQRAGGIANTGEGGEDPAWYGSADGERHDARIKQVASGRFGVTAAYLSRADQLEIKIAQGSKPGEGGQLPARKATAYIAALRRGQPAQAYISPPPHHDIYSIEDLAQLIADLRAISPDARIGVKLVATRGVGTIAAGVAKAGADYVHIAGHAGGTGASPLASIKHVGAPWELGLAEAHQVLLRSGLRDRIALRTDGGLRTGRDVVLAALLGAEEFAFGTALLVALGCDMARQCHLDTCPTGIATQREDLRAKFTGSPARVERFVLALAEDVRRELAALGARSLGEVVGEAARHLRPVRGGTVDLAPVVHAPAWSATPWRRAAPARSVEGLCRAPASALEADLVRHLEASDPPPLDPLVITTAERSFGAALAGAVARGRLRAPIRLSLRGSAGQSFGAFLPSGVDLSLDGVANDHVGKGLSGGRITVAPERDLRAAPDRNALVGNTGLFGATGGRLHVVGRAGMRFAVRNSGATAVVEGLGPHGCEYMTGGTVLVLGPVGASFGAGMTGGRAYLWDPGGAPPAGLESGSVAAVPLSEAADRPDGEALAEEVRGLLVDHAAAGSALADHLLAMGGPDPSTVWLVEPVGRSGTNGDRPASAERATPAPASPGAATGTQPPRSALGTDTAAAAR